jgi:hypothetical protein
VTLQYQPVRHGVHSAAADRPVRLEKVLAGLGCGAVLPAGQCEPAGHVSGRLMLLSGQ